jgi:hypothetical protein
MRDSEDILPEKDSNNESINQCMKEIEMIKPGLNNIETKGGKSQRSRNRFTFKNSERIGSFQTRRNGPIIIFRQG